MQSYPFTTNRALQSIAAGSLLAALLLAAACSPTRTAPPAPQPTATLSPPHVDAARVIRGDIRQSLALSGDLRATGQASVMPTTSGRVQQVLVDVGQQVKAGDTLVVLEQDDAQAQLVLARATVAQAQAKLDSITAGPRPEDVAAAQAGLAQQQIRLQNMRSGGRTEDIHAAEAALSAAEARMSALLNGADDGVRQAQQSAIEADKAALASAEAAFAALGAQNAASLQTAQSQVDSLHAQIAAAQAQITSADAALANLSGSSAADVQAAQSAYDQAYAQLRSAQAALKQNYSPTQADLAQAQAALEQARSQRAAAEAQQTALEHGAASTLCGDVPVAHNSTACGDAKAAASAAVSAADAAIEAAQGQLDLLKRGGGPAQQSQLQALTDQAQAQLNTAKARLEALKGGGVAATRAQAEAQRQQAEAQLIQAQQSLEVAQAHLNATTGGSLDVQVKSAQSEVTAAIERLKSDQARLDVTLGGPTDQEVQQAQAAIDEAEQLLLKARAPFTSYDVAVQEQALAQAQAQLAKTRSPYTDQDVAAAQAAVEQAQAQLDVAALGLHKTIVLAPADGVISERLVSPGALVSPQTAVATLLGPGLELAVNLGENQLGQVAEGQPVQLDVAAYPGRTFNGTVTSIAPIVDARSRTTVAKIRPQDSGGALKAGMSARASIVTESKANVLIAPRESVVMAGPSGGPAVLTLQDSGASDIGVAVRWTPLKIGLTTAELVEITAGLDNGQLIATTGFGELRDGDFVVPRLQDLTARGSHND